MTDREKVIKGLEFCLEDECKGEECPYYCYNDCATVLRRDSFELLKEQEPTHAQKRESSCLWFWCCGSCGVPITEGDKFCRMCGRAVKWDEAD